MDQFKFNKPLALILILGVFICIVLIIKHLLFGSVTLNKVPYDMTLFVDNKKQNSSSVTLLAGKHTIKASRKDFASTTVTIDISGGKHTVENIFLNPSDAAGLQWIIDHPSQAAILDAQVSHESDQNSKTALSKLPLIKKLPYTDSSSQFQIDWGKSLTHPNINTDIAIYISYTSDSSKQAALSWIKSQGYNPKALEIYYVLNPMLSYLPYNTLSFSLSGGFNIDTNNQPQLVINALLLLSEADMSNESASIVQDKQGVISYIESSGANPANYTINYQVSTP